MCHVSHTLVAEIEKSKRFSPCCQEASEPNKGLLNTKDRTV